MTDKIAFLHADAHHPDRGRCPPTNESLWMVMVLPKAADSESTGLLSAEKIEAADAGIVSAEDEVLSALLPSAGDIPFRKRLSYKQARTTVILTLVLGLVLSTGQILVDFLQLQRKTDVLITQVLSTVRDSAAEAAYAFDKALANRLLGGLFEYRPIRQAEIRDDFGSVLASTSRPQEQGSLKWLAELLLPETKQYSVELVIQHNSQYVGELRVTVDRYLIAQDFFSRAGLLLGATALWTIGLGLILVVTFYISITQPFLRLSSALANIDPSRPAAHLMPVIREHERDELGILGRAINRLLIQLDHSLGRHRAAEQRVRERELRLRGIMEGVADGIIAITPDNRIETMNRAALAIFGYGPDEVANLTFDQFLTGNDIRRFLIALARCLERSSELPEIVRQEFTGVRRDGSAVPIFLAVSQMRIDDTVTFICVVQDITERKRAEQALRESEQRLKLAVTATRSGVWDTDLRTGSSWWSPEFITMLGYDPYDPSGRRLNWENLIHPDDLPWVVALKERYLRGDVSEYEPVYRMSRRDGTWVWIEAKGQCLRDASGKAFRFTGTMADVTERKKFEEQLMYMATHDPLTGLPNRTLLQDRLLHAISIAHRRQRRVAALFVDLDRFKLINDSLGHNIGDGLLKAVADAIRSTVRVTETVGRLGGDEFLIIAEDIIDPQDAARIGKAVLNTFSRPIRVGEQQLFVSASIGIAIYEGGDIDVPTLLRHADAAMYSAKASGGNTYRFFIPEMNEEVVVKLALERNLREAVDQNQFEVFYQPKIDVSSLRPIGLEALIRWRQPDGSFVPPNVFIPAAEEMGLIGPIGEWVLKSALKQIANWRERGIAPLPIAVNVSVRQLTSVEAMAAIRGILTDLGDDAAWLEIEITESKMMDNLSSIVEILRELRTLGVRIAIDDFGTGYSSLSYLRRLPINALKVDRSFIDDIPNNPDDAAITATIIAMGRQLGLTVVAEGIETSEQLDFLKQHDCDQAQGYLFAKPMAVNDLELRFLQDKTWRILEASN